MAGDDFMNHAGIVAAFAQMVKGGSIDVNGHLILQTDDGPIDAGFVKGSSTPEATLPTGGTLARRTNDGRSKFAEPIDGEDAANRTFVEQHVASVVGATLPSGMQMMWGGTAATVPAGWLLCDGSEVSRTTYADLFAAIGTTYGAGDGSTTFNLPNGSGRMPMGADVSYSLGTTGGSVTHAHTMPAHTHSIPSHRHSIPAHAHNLSGNGWARWATDRSNDWAGWHVKTGASGWTASWRTGSATMQDFATSTSYTEGVTLDGATDSGGSGNTGTWSGTTGSTDPGDTNDATVLPPYFTTNFVIKT